jgi:hypothetical protein
MEDQEELTINILCDTYEDIGIADLKDLEPHMAKMQSTDGNGLSFPQFKPFSREKTGTEVKETKTKGLKEQITQKVLSVIPAIDEKVINKNGFELAEMEITVGFEIKGDVTVPYLASAGTSANASITFKIRNK